MPAERRFRAMGTDALISIEGGQPSWLIEAINRVESLESKWSRFRPDSELQQLRHKPIAEVSSDTFRLVAAARVAWQRTDGAFDPTVIDAMVANGYGASFDSLGPDAPDRISGAPSPGCGSLELDASTLTIANPVGLGIDPGGIGKGLAADIITEELMARGARGVLVDIGGDIRCRGTGPHDGQWVVELHHPFRSSPPMRLAMTDGAVVTSSTQKRRWGPGRRMHHIVDPRTGMPSTSRVVAASIVAGDAWWAEALATAVVVRGDLSVVTDAHALVVLDDGRVIGTAPLLGLSA